MVYFIFLKDHSGYILVTMVYFTFLKDHFGYILRVKEHERANQEVTEVTQMKDDNGSV